MQNETPYIAVSRAAAQLGIPVAWLRAEAAALRVPCIHAGRMILVNPKVIEAALLERAAKNKAEVANA